MKIIDMPYQFMLDYNNLIINPLIIGITKCLKETIVSKMKGIEHETLPIEVEFVLSFECLRIKQFFDIITFCLGN